ncbi:MAG: CapA family protein [Bacteroidales bacterium]
MKNLCLRTFLPFAFFFHGFLVSGQEHRLRLVFTGDIMGHDSQIASALATGDSGYDYLPNYQYLKPYLDGADLAVGNLEVTLAGEPYRGYPAFSSPDALADALQASGFDILITANNHALDRGRDGLERTLQQLDRRDLLHTGTFADTGQRNTYFPLLMEKNGIRIALLNYAYGTNGIPDKPPTVINRIDTVQIRTDLEKARTAQPDFILVTMHWGNEYQRTENQEQRDLARFLFEHGADAVIGSHPHVVQPIRGGEKGTLVAYSLGNLISNQRDRYRDGGIAFELELLKTAEGCRIAGHGFLPLWVYKPKTAAGTQFVLVPAAVDPQSHPDLAMPEEDASLMKRFLYDTREHLAGHPEVAPNWME